MVQVVAALLIAQCSSCYYCCSCSINDGTTIDSNLSSGEGRSPDVEGAPYRARDSLRYRRDSSGNSSRVFILLDIILCGSGAIRAAPQGRGLEDGGHELRIGACQRGLSSTDDQPEARRRQNDKSSYMIVRYVDRPRPLLL